MTTAARANAALVTMPPLPPSRAVQEFESEIAAAVAEMQEASADQLALSTEVDSTTIDSIRDKAVLELFTLRQESLAAYAHFADQAALMVDARQVWRIVGHYSGLLTRHSLQPFEVTPRLDHGAVVDVTIKTLDAQIPPDAARLKSEIDTVANIIRTVMTERLRRFGFFTSQATRDDVVNLQTEYFNQLIGLAKVGLETAEPTRVTFARQDLERLKSLFTAREAGVVKNEYVWRLLLWAGIAVIVCVASYLLASTSGCSRWLNAPLCRQMSDLRNFNLLAAGTAIGTWLSFSLRTPSMSFGNLAVLEPDRLTPLARIIFTIGLSGTLGLLLFSGAIKAGVGSVEGLDALHNHGSWALLLGLLSGIAERALGSAVSRTGTTFMSAVDGHK